MINTRTIDIKYSRDSHRNAITVQGNVSLHHRVDVTDHLIRQLGLTAFEIAEENIRLSIFHAIYGGLEKLLFELQTKVHSLNPLNISEASLIDDIHKDIHNILDQLKG